MVKVLKESNNNLSELVKYLKSNSYTSIDLSNAITQINNINTCYSKISKDIEEYTGPNSPKLPDGHNPYEQFISNDPEYIKGYTLVLCGDIDDPHNDKVFVAVYTDDFSYSKEFNFYTDFEKAVDLANKLSATIKPEDTEDQVKNILRQQGLQADR